MNGKDSTETLLYLTGDKSRDTLPKILASKSITLDSLQVYETQGSSSFSHDLRIVLEKALSGKYDS